MLNTKSWSSSSSPHLGLILLGKLAFITPLPHPLSQNIFQVHSVLSPATITVTKYNKSLVQATFTFLFIYLYFTCLFLAVTGLCCCWGFF